jgi:uroporphyrinogen-III synthase
MIVLNTRPACHRDAFARAFAPLGLPIVVSPVLAPRVIAPWPDDPGAFDAVVFTSPYAPTLRPDDARWTAKTVFAVGPATAAAARAAGFGRVIRTGGTAAELIPVLARQPFRQAFHPSGADVATDLAALFPTRLVRRAVYRMDPVGGLAPAAVAALAASIDVVVPLFSHRSAAAFAAAVEASAPNRRARLVALGISAAALNITAPPWALALVAPQPTAGAMARTLATRTLDKRRAA